MMLRLFSYIFTLYAILVFIVLLLLVFPAYALYFLIYPVQADVKLYPLTRLWGSLLPILFLVRLIKHYEAKPDKKKHYIYIANHRSMLDIPITATLIPAHFRFLAKKSLTKLPLFGLIIKGICIMVDRASLADKGRSFDKMKKTLAKGSSVLIYPEGTRNKTDADINDFQNGAFKLSKETGIPIIVFTLWSTSDILTKDRFWRLTPGKVDFFISAPVFPGEKSIEELKDDCRQIFLKNIELAKNS